MALTVIRSPAALGAGDGDLGFGIAVDGDGDAYIVGQTYSGQHGDSPSDVFPGTPDCGAWGQKNIGENGATNQGFVSELLAGWRQPGIFLLHPGRQKRDRGASRAGSGVRVGLRRLHRREYAEHGGNVLVGATTGPDGFVVTSNAAQNQACDGRGGIEQRVHHGGRRPRLPHPRPFIRATTAGTGNSDAGAGDVGLAIAVESATEVAITGGAFLSNIPCEENAAQATFQGSYRQWYQQCVCRFVLPDFWTGDANWNFVRIW